MISIKILMCIGKHCQTSPNKRNTRENFYKDIQMRNLIKCDTIKERTNKRRRVSILLAHKTLPGCAGGFFLLKYEKD